MLLADVVSGTLKKTKSETALEQLTTTKQFLAVCELLRGGAGVALMS